MARELSQLLLEEGIVSPEGLRRALARQKEAGGTLDTALLELGLVAEARLVGALARASDLPAAPLSAYERVDARARRVFPSKVAERHGLAPFALEGRELSLVATCPVDLSLLDEVSFMLSLHLAPHVGPEWRVRALIQQLYGGPLPPRLARLAEQSADRGTSPGVVAAEPEAPEPETGGPPASSDEAPIVTAPGIYLGSAMPAITTAPASPGEPGPTRPPAGFAGFSRELGEPLEPLSAALAEALEMFDVESPEAPPDAPADAAPDAGIAVAEPGDGPGPGAPASSEAPNPLDRSAPPRWTLEQARAALARARTRDEVVVTVLRYARDFFQFAALFAVTRDAIAGHDGLGPEGDARDLARTVAIYSSDLGIFRTAIETMAPYLGRVDRNAPANQAVLDALGRGTPRTVLVTPILLRNRPVCLLYADNGGGTVSARRLGDLLLFCSTIGAAFERIIKTRKGEGPSTVGSRPAEAPPGPFQRSEPAWRGPGSEPAKVTAAEADFFAAGGQLEPDELFAPIVEEPAPIPEEPPPSPREASSIPDGLFAPIPEEAAPFPAEPASTLEADATFLLEPAKIREEAAPIPAEPAPAPEEAALFPVEAAPVLEAAAPAPEEAVLFPVEAALAPEEAALLQVEPEPALEAAAPAPEEAALFPVEPAPAPEEAALFPVEAAPVLEAAAPAPDEAVLFPVEPAPILEDPAPTAEVTTELALPEPEPGPEPLPPEPPLDLAPEAPVERGAAAAAAGETLPHGVPDPAGELVDAYLATGPSIPAARGPAFEALVAIGQPAVPLLLAALDNPAPSRRRAAAELLGAIGDPASLAALADRCLDPAPEVAEAAREALAAHRGTAAIRTIPERLRRALASGLSARAAPAARALAALRDVESIPILIQALEGADPSTAAAIAEALSIITMQRHGSSPRPWLLWWKENRGRGRAEWIFGGLTAEDREVRAAAAAELGRIAPPPVSYSPDSTSAEREQAARAWAGWFTRSGYRL